MEVAIRRSRKVPLKALWAATSMWIQNALVSESSLFFPSQTPLLVSVVNTSPTTARSRTKFRSGSSRERQCSSNTIKDALYTFSRSGEEGSKSAWIVRGTPNLNRLISRQAHAFTPIIKEYVFPRLWDILNDSSTNDPLENISPVQRLGKVNHMRPLGQVRLESDNAWEVSEHFHKEAV
jgi:hypothetical protein